MAKFSVVTISFNQAEFLERAILSVIGQQGVDLDYVVVDPGSTDGSREIIERYRDRITTVILDPDRGAADGLNKGLAACTGDLFGFINADDELHPNALVEAAALFEREPGVDVFCGSSWQVDESGRRSRFLITSPHITSKLCARGVAIVVQQSAFMRMKAIRAVNGFDPDNRTCWDGELFHRMVRAGSRFKRVNRTWAAFRIYPGSITGSQRMAERYREERGRMFEREFGRPYAAHDPLLKKLSYVFETIRDPFGLRWKLFNRLLSPRLRSSS
jgi:glycosyltransferase involved in cell wall biosynthesis